MNLVGGGGGEESGRRGWLEQRVKGQESRSLGSTLAEIVGNSAEGKSWPGGDVIKQTGQWGAVGHL